MSTILVVEDSPVFRESLKELLSSHLPAATVEEAADAEQALAYLQAASADIMLVDVRLPGQSGLELTRRVKDRYPSLPVIIVTNYDIEEYRDAAIQYGADDFVAKGSREFQTICVRIASLLA